LEHKGANAGQGSLVGDRVLGQDCIRRKLFFEVGFLS